MKQKKDTDENKVLRGVEPALQRAAPRAREIAAATGTPLVISVHGKIKKIWFRSKRTTRPSR